MENCGKPMENCGKLFENCCKPMENYDKPMELYRINSCAMVKSLISPAKNSI
jgi:hypothetical protein